MKLLNNFDLIEDMAEQMKKDPELAQKYEIQLGSLFPDFTERTVLEDDEFLRHISCGKLSKITLYDSTIKSEINKSVKKSDYLFFECI